MTDNNAAYHSVGAAKDDLVFVLPLLAPPSCPLVVLPSHCAGWLLRGFRLMLPPSSNATATAATATAAVTAIVNRHLCCCTLAIASALSIVKERGSIMTTTIMPKAAPM
jgi:hypothetical protein